MIRPSTLGKHVPNTPPKNTPRAHFGRAVCFLRPSNANYADGRCPATEISNSPTVCWDSSG